MQFNIGDKVKFLNDVGSGIIKGRKNKEIYIVENQDGFDMPVYVSELILIDNNDNNILTDKQENIEQKEEKTIEEINFNDDSFTTDTSDNNEINLFLALVPKNENDILGSDIEVFFINDSSFFAVTVIKSLRNKKYHLVKSLIVEPDTKIKVFDIERENINDFSKIFVQVILYKQVSQYHNKTYDKKIVLKANKLYSLNSFKENDYTEEPAILFSIDKVDENYEKPSKNTEKILRQKVNSDLRKIDLQNKKNTEKKSDTIEVDLHIEELLDSHSGLSNFEILSIQIAEFKRQMEKAIVDKQIRKVVFIHGVGEGKLKFELRKVLDKEYRQYEYQDASFEKYGYGATMVIVR